MTCSVFVGSNRRVARQGRANKPDDRFAVREDTHNIAALANDQADRLAKLITSEPALAGVTAGIYTGEATGSVKKVTKDSLINDRDQIRQDPPDILLAMSETRAHPSRRDQCCVRASRPAR